MLISIISMKRWLKEAAKGYISLYLFKFQQTSLPKFIYTSQTFNEHFKLALLTYANICV